MTVTAPADEKNPYLSPGEPIARADMLAPLKSPDANDIPQWSPISSASGIPRVL